MTKYQPGDEVTVRGRVVDYAGSLGVRVLLSGNEMWAHQETIATHTPKPQPLAVGDRVVVRGHGMTGAVLALDDDDAWVRVQRGSKGYHDTFRLADLERLP